MRRPTCSLGSANKVASTVEAAVRKGQLFATLADLACAEAFWIDHHGQVMGMVEMASVATVIERLGLYDIEWLPVPDAAARMWSDLADHRKLADAVSDTLRRELSCIAAGVESTELAAESPLAAARKAGTASRL